MPEAMAELKPGWVLPVIICLATAAFLLLIAAIILSVLLGKRSRTLKRLRNSPEPSPKYDVRPVASVEVGKVHEQGKREYQQDSFGVSDSVLMPTHGCLAIVADGMGGLSDGDKVSIRTVEELLDGFPMYQGKGTHEQVLLMLTQKALKSVNSLLGADGIGKSGSTLVMGLIKGSCFSYVSIGDSRICLCRRGTLIPLNREHVYRHDLLMKALNEEMSFSEAYSDKNGPGLTSFLGMGRLLDVDMPAEPIRVYPGDKIILMSDGVYNAISNDELLNAVKDSSPAAAAEAIRAAVEAKGYSNQDNYTGIILECRAEPNAASDSSADEPKAAVPPETAKPRAAADDIPETAEPV